MKQKALTALLLGLFGILVYAALRFEWSYAIAAAVGQLHDVPHRAQHHGAARPRAHLAARRRAASPSPATRSTIRSSSSTASAKARPLREKGSFYEVINRSLNLTLARTILTGSTCLLATLALILFGGPVIHDFSLTMFIGILSGIYSSHFISPGLAWWLGRLSEGTASGGASGGGNKGVPTKPSDPTSKKTPVGAAA